MIIRKKASSGRVRSGTSQGPARKTSSSHRGLSKRKQLPPIKRPDSVFAKAGGEAVSQESPDFQGHRLQKILAAAGFGSRRQCEELIEQGRVSIDGKTISLLGTKVFPNRQAIRVDGESLPKMRPVYIALNKPTGFLCTNKDQQGRRRSVDLIPAQFGRLFPVGRLDQNSEGLLIMTNDGALAQRLTHPRYEVPKKYRVQVAGLVAPDLVRDLKKGIHLAETMVQADDVVLKSCHKLSSILEITIKEGKNREIRRMLARLGHKVMQLQRIAVGSVRLGKMAPGEYRLLTKIEVEMLYRVAELSKKSQTEH